MGWGSASNYSGPDTSDDDTRYRLRKERKRLACPMTKERLACQLRRSRLQHREPIPVSPAHSPTSIRSVSSEEAEDKSNDILIPDESEYMESDLDSCKVPVIEIPYWKVGKDHGQITLYNWEFGVGDAKKWPFDETHYNRWEACQPWGFSKCSIWRLHPCKDFDQLTRRMLCPEDQVLNVYDLLDRCSVTTEPIDGSRLGRSSVDHYGQVKYRGGWEIYSLCHLVKPSFDLNMFKSIPAQYGHLYFDHESTKAAVFQGYYDLDQTTNNALANTRRLPRHPHKIWLALSRFLFHTSLKPHHGQGGGDIIVKSSNPKGVPLPPPPGPSASKTFIEASIFKYLDLGLSAALVTGWFDPPRTPSLMGGMAPVQPLTISSLQSRAEKALSRRARALTRTKTIAHPYDVPPRRLWDLKMNRVVPWYLIDNPDAKAPPPFIAISHSWVDEKDLVFVETPVNCYAWPVPLPSGTDLQAIRTEILDAFPGFRYCWLDVLCLRQQAKLSMQSRGRAWSIEDSPLLKSASRIPHAGFNYDSVPHPPQLSAIFDAMPLAQQLLLEALWLKRDGDSTSDKLRRVEHHIDVPTIGNVYKLAKGVFRYFNGLGRRFSPTGWNSPYHWFNRAWTLQETVPGSVDGGVRDWDGNYLNIEGYMGRPRKKFRDFITEIEKMAGKATSIIDLAQEMGRRYTTNGADKITGLSYLLQMKHLPIYEAHVGVNHAWRRSLWEMPKEFLLELLFNCPVVDMPQWVPSWHDLSNLPPTFVPYPDFQPHLARDGDIRSRFFTLCMELGYPRSLLSEMYHTLSVRYSALKHTPGCPGYPFAFDGRQSATDHLNEDPDIGSPECPLQKRRRELIGGAGIHSLSDSSNGTSGATQSAGDERSHSSGQTEDESYAYVSFIRGVKRPGIRQKRDREVGIRGWCLEVLSMACTQGNDFCIQVYTSKANTKKTRNLNFFVSHDGLGDSQQRLSETNPPESARGSPKAVYVLFTPRLPRLHVQDSARQAAAPTRATTCKLEAHNGCSAWLVLKADESGASIYQKVGVLRSDETFRLRWMTEGLLRAHLRSGCIFIDTTPKPKTSEDYLSY